MSVWAHSEYVGSQDIKGMLISCKDFEFVERNKTLGNWNKWLLLHQYLKQNTSFSYGILRISKAKEK